ncbi:hypothetical protein E2320_012550 [Naja naja]|nr:hypothetical protein E2320_012550 [Naja naja]
MELRILEPRVRVLSLARRGLWLYTHPLLKMLLLPQRSRCRFFSLTETPEDYTIMVDEDGFKGMTTFRVPVFPHLLTAHSTVARTEKQ